MPSSYNKLPYEPIVIITLPADYNLESELPTMLPKYLHELNFFREPVFWIVDARVAPFTVNDILTGVSLVAKGQHPLYRHPNIRQVIYVTTKRMLVLAAEGLGHENFGSIAIKLFDDMDEALKFARNSQ